MQTGFVHLHNFLRWVIVILLVVSIVKAYSGWSAKKTFQPGDKKVWLFTMIASHITLLLGLYQYFFGAVGIKMIQAAGMGVAMKDSTTRFWAVEHIFSMLLAIALITIGHVKYKKTLKANSTRILYVIALILILLAMPWPFRSGIGRPLFPGMA